MRAAPLPGAVEVMADNHRRAQRVDERLRSVEVGHLHVRRTESLGHMRVTPRTARQIELVRQRRRLRVEVRKRRLRVERLQGVDEPLAREGAQLCLTQVVPHRVERVGDVHETALRSDARGRLRGAHTERHAFREEQTDDFTCVGAELLADHDAARQLAGQLERTPDGVVVGDAQHVDARRDDGLLDLVGRRRAIARPHRVGVQIDAHPARTHGLCEVRMASDRLGAGGGHESYDPLRETSPITRLTPASPPGSHSRSDPTAWMSSSIR